MFLQVTSWTLTAIALDKFVHINNPTLSPLHMKSALLTTCVVWVISSSANVPYVFSTKLQSGAQWVSQQMPG